MERAAGSACAAKLRAVRVNHDFMLALEFAAQTCPKEHARTARKAAKALQTAVSRSGFRFGHQPLAALADRAQISA